MQSKPDLQALIRIASKGAEGIFRKTGELLPMYHAVTSYGQTMIVPQPDPNKDVSVALIKLLFAEEDVAYYCFISEAWMLAAAKNVPAVDIAKIARQGLEYHPDRREIIAFSAESRDGQAQTARRFILRPEMGKPTLSPLIMDNMEGRTSEGRMVGLLTKEKP